MNDIEEATFTKFGVTLGVTLSVKDGVIKVKGTVLTNANIKASISNSINIVDPLTLQSGETYIYNPNPIKGAESSNCFLDFTNSRTFGASLPNKMINKPFKLTDLKAQFPFFLIVTLKKGTVVDMEWKPQLLLNEVLLPYKPYKEQSIQLLITLNAIPVSSDGNVTINGQQYIADYVDVERGKIVRMCRRKALNTKDGEIDEEYRIRIRLDLKANDGDKECIFSTFKWTSLETCAAGDLVYLKNIKKPNNELYTAQELKELSLDFDVIYQLSNQQETDLTAEQTQALKELATYYPVTNISVNSEQVEGYTVFNYPISLANGWNYVKKQLNDNRDYIYDMDLQSAEAYVNSEYAVALTELEV